MQVSEGSDTFRVSFSARYEGGAPADFEPSAGVAVRHLQHFNHPGRAWHDLSGPQDTLTVVLAEIGGRCEARTNLHRPAALERQRPNHVRTRPLHNSTALNIQSVVPPGRTSSSHRETI